ncbi:MAG: nucleotidyltransferase family protein [Clostridia bacterium]|nr:nucleotidyltransferase family protein [Clostridia bacterium]
MSTDFQDVIYLFSCAALGKTAKINHKINLGEIYKISNAQGIWQTVFLSIEQLYESKQIDIDADLYNSWKQSFMKRAVLQLQRRDVINNVLTELEKNGIKAYILKGDAVARYYAEPLGRVSSDTDVYVGKAAIDSAEKILRQCGFEVYARSPMEHATNCVHPVIGSVDLHLTFHDDCFEEKYFCNYTDITEERIKYTTSEGYEYYSLGVNDNAVFLFLHLVKHFLSCGTGIRQIVDFLLFWKNNKEAINIMRFKKMLSDLNFNEIFSACVYIALNYLQFEKADFADFEINADNFFVDWLLMDIEQGGVFGNLEQRKLTIHYLFGSRARVFAEKNSRLRYIKLYIKSFGYDFLSKKYPYAAKHKFLLPIAYINRFADLIASAFRIMSTVKKATIENDEFKNIKNRMSIINKVCQK